MKKKIVYGHGDVIVIPVKKIPAEAQEKKGPAILAYGEVTGHSHQISKGVAAMYGYDDKVYMRVKSEISTLSHEEHAKIELPAGDYEIKIQREYEPGGWKTVID